MLGGWHSLELSSRDAVGCKGGTGVCWAWGWGTALGPTWDEATVRAAVSQSPPLTSQKVISTIELIRAKTVT